MSGVVIRHGRLDVVLDPGDPVRVTRNGWSCLGRVTESAPGRTTIAFEVPPPDGLSDEEDLARRVRERFRVAIGDRPPTGAAPSCPTCGVVFSCPSCEDGTLPP